MSFMGESLPTIEAYFWGEGMSFICLFLKKKIAWLHNVCVCLKQFKKALSSSGSFTCLWYLMSQRRCSVFSNIFTTDSKFHFPALSLQTTYIALAARFPPGVDIKSWIGKTGNLTWFVQQLILVIWHCDVIPRFLLFLLLYKPHYYEPR